MIARKTQILAASILSLGSLAIGATVTHPADAQTVTPRLRGERASRHDIRSVERRLERIIATLQRDQRDYGGHRASAVALLQQADQQLEAAIATDTSTPR